MYIETIPITMNAKVEPATGPMITGRSCDDSFSSLAVVIGELFQKRVVHTKFDIYVLRG
jgi:hypothetical protein